MQIVLDSFLASAVMRSPRTTAYLMAAVNIRLTFSDSDKFSTIDWINCLWLLSKLCRDAAGSDWCAVGSWSVRGGKAAPSWLGSSSLEVDQKSDRQPIEILKAISISSHLVRLVAQPGYSCLVLLKLHVLAAFYLSHSSMLPKDVSFGSLPVNTTPNIIPKL
ncbi:ribosomal RNA large subunit methyltransferase H [Striga asiatica]|uniref:Ribosomal RNA large subunit methyltransferase H n=1 Tax=Striga asiatica TaxID=4170 RepID=A0A5A7QSF9_STRAF|nr:ribosomal RNA large subunit methyltransferase H [Striga asiatica]